MVRAVFNTAVWATAVSVADAQYSAEKITGTVTCGEYFEKGGFCTVMAAVKKDDSTPCTDTDPIGCKRKDCCTGGVSLWSTDAAPDSPIGTEWSTYLKTVGNAQGVPAITSVDAATDAKKGGYGRCDNLDASKLNDATKAVPSFWAKSSCIAIEQSKRDGTTPCGAYSSLPGTTRTLAKLKTVQDDAANKGKAIFACLNIDCCQFDPSIKTCKNFREAGSRCPGENPEGDFKSCRATFCTKAICCYKTARTCGVAFFPTEKCDLSFYYDRKTTTVCSSYDCSVDDCCKIKPNIGKCTTWWDSNHNCGQKDKTLKYRKIASTRCLAYQCEEKDCCDAGKTCAGYKGCSLPKVLTHLTSTSCKNGVCDVDTCCVTRAQCAASDCASPAVLKDDAKSKEFRCAATPCTPDECCQTPAGATPAPPGVTPSPTVAPERKTSTCDSFKDCTGKDMKGRKYTSSLGKAVKCVGGCDKETCCGKEAEATCFPGESGVCVRDGSRVTLAELDLNMAVLSEERLEPVIGMLHSHSDISATVLHSMPMSAS